MSGETMVTTRIRWFAAAAATDWEAVYEEQLPRVYNFFRYTVGNRAEVEDLTSITFEKAWRGRRSYRPERAGAATWLLAIARNVARDHFRRRRPQEPLEAAAEIAGGATPEELAERRSEAERLERLLAGRPARERELIALKYGAGLNNREIARLTGLGESNVGTILHRAVQALRALW